MSDSAKDKVGTTEFAEVDLTNVAGDDSPTPEVGDDKEAGGRGEVTSVDDGGRRREDVAKSSVSGDGENTEPTGEESLRENGKDDGGSEEVLSPGEASNQGKLDQDMSQESSAPEEMSKEVEKGGPEEALSKKAVDKDVAAGGTASCSAESNLASRAEKASTEGTPPGKSISTGDAALPATDESVDVGAAAEESVKEDDVVKVATPKEGKGLESAADVTPSLAESNLSDKKGSVEKPEALPQTRPDQEADNPATKSPKVGEATSEKSSGVPGGAEPIDKDSNVSAKTPTVSGHGSPVIESQPSSVKEQKCDDDATGGDGNVPVGSAPSSKDKPASDAVTERDQKPSSPAVKAHDILTDSKLGDGEKFQRLGQLVQEGRISNREVVNAVLNLVRPLKFFPFFT